jgi:soluble lytic murein transglycosylase-like protein
VPSLSPALVDPVREELKAIGVSPDPLKRDKEILVGEERVRLTPDEDLAIRRATGTLRLVLLKDLMASPEYQDASAEERASAAKRQIRRAGSVVQEGARGLIRGDSPVTFEALTEGLEDPEVTEQRQAPQPAATSAAPIAGPPTRFDSLFQQIGSAVGVDPTFLKAVAKTESSFNPTAKGPPTKYGTAIGMFQILPSTFRLFEAEARRILGREPSIENLADNALVGALFYRDLLDRTDNDPAAAARYYHGGEILANHGPKTRAYGQKVADTYLAWSGQ